MDKKDQKYLYDSIDKKFLNMTEDELNEYELDIELKLSRQTGKQLDSKKRNGYLKKLAIKKGEK